MPEAERYHRVLITNGSGFGGGGCEESVHGQWEPQKNVTQGSSPGESFRKPAWAFQVKALFPRRTILVE